MPRQAIIDAPGALHLIIARGIKQYKIFKHDADRERFGKIMGDTETRCYAWALLKQ